MRPKLTTELAKTPEIPHFDQSGSCPEEGKESVVKASVLFRGADFSFAKLIHDFQDRPDLLAVVLELMTIEESIAYVRSQAVKPEQHTA